MTKLYHRDAYGLPDGAVKQITELRSPLAYSRHALNDRYGTLPAAAFPTVFDMRHGWSVVEVEEESPGFVSKIVVRRPADSLRSLVLVILPKTGVVKTLWTNLNSDNHGTLDKSKFSKPCQVQRPTE